MVKMSIEKDSTLKWTTKGESGKLTYTIEQFRWNRWVKIGEIGGIGTVEINNYSFKVFPHSGKNQYRIKQIGFTGQPKFSKSLEYLSSSPAITYRYSKISKEIVFYIGNIPVETMFEIYDQYGKIIKQGFASKIDASNLVTGSYYLNSDDKISEFIISE